MTPILACVGIVIAGVLVGVAATKADRDAFEARFPPISDEEFLARCRPGTNSDVALKVRRIVAEYFDVEYERVYPSARFVDDLGAD